MIKFRTTRCSRLIFPDISKALDFRASFQFSHTIVFLGEVSNFNYVQGVLIKLMWEGKRRGTSLTIETQFPVGKVVFMVTAKIIGFKKEGLFFFNRKQNKNNIVIS